MMRELICENDMCRSTHIAEEIADVEIMLAQMKIIFDCEREVELQRRRKVNRLAYRLDADEKGEKG